MYNTIWLTYVRNNLFEDIRKAVWIAYVHALLAPIRKIDVWFEAFRDEIAEEYRWNGTSHSLEKLLNDRYDPVQRRIYIVDISKIPVLYMKGGNEMADAYYTQTNEEVEHHYYDADALNASVATTYEMKVMFHASISFIPDEVMELMETYRFAGARPAIFTFGVGGVETEISTGYLNPG